ncbi:MAG: SsrA-binding protein [Candidatus Puniceispirillum sp.]|nr:SsrA-binding protein [Candidatus Pelagibacter sp.]MBA4282884.1 SsrA-binding protein [Candidatus Puniceispirillum sp.]
MSSNKKEKDNYKVIAFNKSARFHYEIIETLEAGIVLMGSEVKSIRQSKVSINEAYIDTYSDEHIPQGTLCLINSNISEYKFAHSFGHSEKRARPLLLRQKQQSKWTDAKKKKGYTIIPLKMYFNERGKVKLEIALATGKKLHDKRETLKNRDWEREKNRLLKN